MSSLHPRETHAAQPPATPEFKPVFTRGALLLLIALLLGETTINFIDRQVVSVLAHETVQAILDRLPPEVRH